MPKVDTVVEKEPDTLRPFTFHGVHLEEDGKGNAIGDCILCGREGKFFVNVSGKQDSKHFLGGWDCKTCGAKGNTHTFIRKLYEASRVDVDLLTELAKERKYLSYKSLEAWGVKLSPNGDIIVPGYSFEGKLTQLYKLVEFLEKGVVKRRLIPTPTLGHALHGVNLYDPKKHNVYVNEGFWDGVSLWEILGRTKQTDDGEFIPTGSDSFSLLSNTNVLAVPGCNVFQESWSHLVESKCTVLMFHNDHPRKHPKNGSDIPPAGLDGMKSITKLLSTSEHHPKTLSYLKWGEQGYNLNLKSGYDVRDQVTNGIMIKERIKGLFALVNYIQPIEPSWIGGSSTIRSNGKHKKGSVEIQLETCEDWNTLRQAWLKAMKFIDGLDVTLSVMLACIASTRVVGSQFWLKVIAPPSTGKSTLCEALSVNKKYVYAKSTIRGFHSGYRETADTSEDNSLISQLYNKTLITKDGDTLLKAPNKEQILSEARDIYDRVSRTHYRNKASKDYEGVNLTWILCGTSAMRELDTSELGARFLDVVVMEGIDRDLEDEILHRVAHRAQRNMSLESNGDHSTQHDPMMLKAMQLTGGYVSYLRENSGRLLEEVVFDDETTAKFVAMGKFVAYLRARPSSKQSESAEREFAARLVEQFVRLATCLTVVLNRKTVDSEVMRRTRQVARDTARGRTMELIRILYELGESGSEPRALAIRTGHLETEERNLLRFLRKIHAVEQFEYEQVGHKPKQRYRLTEEMTNLFKEVACDG